METELNRIDPLAPARGVVVGAALGSLVWGAGIVAALALCSGCAGTYTGRNHTHARCEQRIGSHLCRGGADVETYRAPERLPQPHSLGGRLAQEAAR